MTAGNSVWYVSFDVGIGSGGMGDCAGYIYVCLFVYLSVLRICQSFFLVVTFIYEYAMKLIYIYIAIILLDKVILFMS